MAFKFILAFVAVLATANASGLFAPAFVAKVATPSIDAVGATHENVVRSFGGTVSTHSKAVDTPYSSIRKVDSRITNNVYSPAVAKTVTYAAPAVSYAAPAPVVYSHHAPAPVVYSHHAAAPAPVVYSHHAAAPSPVVYSHAAANPAPYVYSHANPGFVKQAVTYSPALAVAHVSFDGFGTHWGY